MPLEAGIGPANPPCPACGEPLFGWATAPDAAPVRRCEACGLGVVGDPGNEAEALAALEQLRVRGGDDPRYRIANRASLQASLGGSGWALIEAGSRYLFTAEAVRRLASGRDQQVARVRWRPGASVVSMWGTLLNSFTWGRNVALGAVGRAVATPAGRRWQRAIDAFISVVATPLVLLAAVLLETGAALAGRGGVLELTLRLE
ncbi:MAG: hypothetical protein AABM43_05625 [Actinomycetota bacterium]